MIAAFQGRCQVCGSTEAQRGFPLRSPVGPVLKAMGEAPKGPTVRDLELLLEAEDDTPIEILPDGSIRAIPPERQVPAGSSKEGPGAPIAEAIIRAAIASIPITEGPGTQAGKSGAVPDASAAEPPTYSEILERAKLAAKMLDPIACALLAADKTAREVEALRLEDYSLMLNWAHDLGAKDGEDMREIIGNAISQFVAVRKIIWTDDDSAS